MSCKNKVRLIDIYKDKASLMDNIITIEYTTLLEEDKLKKLIPILKQK